jgi:hypothetical protein
MKRRLYLDVECASGNVYRLRHDWRGGFWRGRRIAIREPDGCFRAAKQFTVELHRESVRAMFATGHGVTLRSLSQPW